MRYKKAQIYIFTSLILIGLAFATVAPSVVLKKPSPLFKELYHNYLTTYPKAINNAFYENKNISGQLHGFTETYLDYANSRDPKFGLLYVFVDGKKIEVRNYLKESVEVEGINLADKDHIEFDKKEEVSIRSDGLNYNFKTSNEPLQVYAMFKSKRGEDIKVYKT